MRQQGAEFEGLVEATEADHHAIAAWNMLADGTGGINWAGLPYVTAHLGVQDVGGLVERLVTIKTHRAPDVARKE